MEDKKELTPEQISAKLDTLEEQLKNITKERDTIKEERDALQKKVNSLRIDGLTKQVETTEEKPVEDEQVILDFEW